MARTEIAPAVWNGNQLLDAFAFAAKWLDANRDSINALNVFPVPDGDTGTNMALTIKASLEAARDAEDPSSVGSVASKLAFGALMGARGNSGVILSQICRGFAVAIGASETLDGPLLARGLGGARDMAYKAVMKPVEGTMLSVIAGAAERANQQLESRDSLEDVLAAALDGAKIALANTPNQLDILRQAGVVDAGGQGIVHILDALHRFAHGDTTIDETSSPEQLGAEMRFLDDVADTHGEDAFGYCTNFMVFGENMDFEHVRSTFADMGRSAVIVGDSSVVKVHIHTEEPGDILSHALTLGYLDQIKIDNMTLQTETLARQRKAAKAGTPAETPLAGTQGHIGVVAVAAGDGLRDALTAMGADLVISGGQTMNPSTEEILHAVRSLPVDEVVILPNNKNIVMAAGQVRNLTDKHVAIIPTTSVPQGLGALAAFNPENSLDANERAMNATLDDIHAIEITVAVRDVDLDGVSVTQGDVIGLLDGTIMASGHDVGSVVDDVLERVPIEEPELLTMFTGEDATDANTAMIERVIRETWPDAEIETLDGNQPHYWYVISVE